MQSSFLPLSLLLLLLFLSLLFTPSSSQMAMTSAYSATITSLSPSTLGLNGGTSITLLGVGFMRGEGTTATTDGATLVFVNNQPCVEVEYYTTDNQFVCIAPPSPIVGAGVGVAQVVMTLTGTGWGTFATCADSVTHCRLTYALADTPQFFDAPLAGSAGSIVAWQGYFIAPNVSQLDARIGSFVCLIPYPTFTMSPTTPAFAAALAGVDGVSNLPPASATDSKVDASWYAEPLASSGLYTLQCQVQEQVAGRYNLTLLVNPSYSTTTQPATGYGYATQARFAYRVDDVGGLPYTFTQVPTVTSISPAVGGTAGGGLVTILGTSFGNDCSALSVQLAGAAATPISCSMNSLVVQPAAQTDFRSRAASSLAVGQAGLLLQSLASANGRVTASTTQLNGFNNSFALDGYHRLSGVLVAPYDGQYSFMVNGNGNGQVWYSTSTSNYTALSLSSPSLSYTARNDLYTTAGQVSATPVSLSAGQAIFLDAAYYSTQFALGMRIHNPALSTAAAQTTPFLSTDSVYAAQHESVPTIQQISLVAKQVREVQQLFIQGVSSGTLALYTSTAISSSFAVDSSASVYLAAVNSIQPCLTGGSVSVTKAYVQASTAYYGILINVTYNCPATATRDLLNIAQVQFFTNQSNANPVTAENWYSTQLQAPSNPLSGSFRLNYGGNASADAYDKNFNMDGNWTPLMAPTTSQLSVQQALLTLTGVNDMTVTRSGNSYDSAVFSLVFYNPAGNVPCLNTDFSALHGDIVTATCTVLQVGSLDRYYPVIPGQWLHQVGDQNQAVVTVNSIPSTCGARGIPNTNASLLSDCAYTYDSTVTPTLISVSPTTASLPGGFQGTAGLTAGTTITVTGTGFTTSADTVVHFLPQFVTNAGVVFPTCSNTAVTSTQILCTLPSLSAGTYNVQVQVLSKGVNAPVSPNPAITFAFYVTSVFPTSGSTAGGSLLVVQGVGFHMAQSLAFVGNDSFVNASSYSVVGADLVTIGGRVCMMESMSLTTMVCRVPPSGTTAGTTPQLLVSNAYSGTFTYDQSSTPTVSSVTPSQISSGVSTYVTISGSGFLVNANVASELDALQPVNPYGFSFQNHYAVYDNSLFAPFAVHFGLQSCNIVNVSSTTIVCLLVRAPPQDLHTLSNAVQPQVYVQGLGYAATTASVQLGLQINSISPTYGSLAGGQYLTLSGSGFVNSSTLNVQLTLLANVTLDNFPAMTGGVPFKSLSGSSNGANGSLATAWAWLPLVVQCDVASVSYTQLVCFTESTGLWPANFSGFDSIVSKATVVINNIASVCGTADESASCYYGFAPLSTPLVSSVSPTSGGVGTTLTIRGSNFASHTLQLVLIGHDACGIVSSNATTILCSVIAHTALTAPVQVLFSDAGWALHSSGPLTFTHLLFIDHMNVTTGSYAGGTYSTLFGNGFSPVLTDNALTIGGLPAVLVSSTYSQLTFISPPALTTVAAAGVVERLMLTVTGYYYANYAYPNLAVYSAYPVLGDANPALVYTTSTALTGNTLGQQPASATNATWSYASALTPLITGVQPLSGVAGAQLTISGSGFGSTQTASSGVYVANLPCSVSSWSATSILCVMGSVAAGTYPVDVYVGNQGLAYAATQAVANASSFTVPLSVTSTSSMNGGYGGGTLLTISGAGFSLIPADNVVSICNTRCAVQSATTSQLTCLTDTLATLDRIRAIGPTTPVVATGAIIANMGAGVNASQLALAFDMNTQTTVTSTISSTCYLGLDVGAGSALAVTSLRWFAPFTQAASANGGSFQASNDGQSWTTLGVIANPNEAWNEIDVVDTTQPTVNISSAYRYIRYYAPPGGKCSMAELEFIGYMVSSVTTSLPATGFSATASCPATVTVSQPDSLFAAQRYVDALPSTAVSLPAFTYSLTSTPLVTAINPYQGSSLGGTQVTISGVGFSDVAHTSVYFSSYPCLVSFVNATAIVCTTTARSTIGPSPTGRQVLVTVNAASSGNAILAANPALNTSPLVLVPILPSYRYIDRWSSINTWANNEPPKYNDTVIIPEGQTILMDIPVPLVFVLLVQGVLVWDTTQTGLTLDAYYIWVNGGTFTIGTEVQPMMKQAVVTLHGDRQYTLELPHIGSKVLNVGGRGAMAMGSGYMPYARYSADSNPSVSDNYDNIDGRGVLDIHGQPRLRTWTKVAKSALAGTSTIVTAELVDFVAGETIFITASSGNMWETEVLTVQSLAADNRTITVTTPLQFDHTSYWYSAGGQQVDLRVEVAILSRNVVIQGDSGSDAQQYGAHTMMTPGGIMRIENAEFTKCGQGFNLGRYCIHWHLAGDAHESYAKSNSIHRSYQRATTVHGTELVTVFNEVAYDVKGHTFFVEDGAERDNTWSQNLGVLTQPLYTMLDGDKKPATFWTSSPTNVWIGNVAAGSSHDGFWFQLPGNPGGPSFTTTICPVHAALGQFYNNTAKNNGVHGLRLYPEYTPMSDPCNPASAPLDTYFYNFTAFRNGGNGIFGKANGALHHVNHQLLQNAGGELSWVKYVNVNYTWAPCIKNLLAVGTIDPAQMASSGWKVGVWLSQYEYQFVDGVTFVNYGSSPALSGCNDCDSSESYRQGGYTYRVKNLRFINSTVRTYWNDPPKEIFHDLDGSLTGYVNGTATPYYAWNEWPECVRQGANFTLGLVCNGQVRVRRMQMSQVAPNQLNYLNLAVQGQGATTNVTGVMPFRPTELYGWVLPMVTNKAHSITFSGSSIDWTQMLLRYSEPEYVRDLPSPNSAGENLGLQFSFIDYRYSYSVLYPGNVANLASTAGSYYVPYLNTSLPATALGGGYPTVSSPFGTGALSYNNVSAPAGGVYQLEITTINTTSNAAQWMSKYQMLVTANQCPPSGCAVVQPAGVFGPPVYWSQAASWVGITANSQVPNPGDTVTIPSTVYMIMDLPTVTCDQLTVQGKLEFLDGMNHELIATRIAVTGYLNAGNTSHPFQSQLTITLTGNRLSPTLIVTNNLFLGNKVMGVFGSVNLVGTPRAFVQTRLQATVMPGDTQLLVVDPVDWVVGDSLVISSTEYDATQMENFTITAVQYATTAGKKTATIVVNAPFAYRHFAGSIQHNSPYLAAGKATSLSAVVALVNRNIVFRGDMSGSSGYGYGASIVVSEIPSVTAPLVGKFNVSYVQFQDVGKLNLSNPALLFNYYSAGSPYAGGGYYYQGKKPSGTQQKLASSAINAMRGCSLVNTWNQGIVAQGAQGMYLDSNVVVRAYTSAFQFDSYSYSPILTNNVVVGSYRSPSDSNTWVHPIAAFYLNTPPFALTGNTATGSADAGYTVRLTDCSAGYGQVYGNEAHANLIGLYILPDHVTATQCVAVYGWTLWKNSHVGLLTVDQLSNVEVNNAVVSDNHIGISLNFARGSVDDHVYISNSVIMGSTAASTCQQSLTCHAVSPTDLLATSGRCGSVYGPSYRRVGLMTLAYMNDGHTCEVDADGFLTCLPPNTPTRLCGMPWENRYGLPSSSFSLFNVTATTFAYWNASDCGLTSAAVAWNPSQIDHTPIVNMRGITWTNADVNAHFLIKTTDASASCVGSCDGRDQIGIRDEDGSALGIAMSGTLGHTLVSDNPLVTGSTPSCQYQSSWGAFACANTVFRRLIFESEDIDRGTRRIGPLLINRQTFTNLSYFSVGPIDDECPIRDHFSWFPFLVQPGVAHDIEPTGTTPAYVRMTFLSQDPSEKMIVSVFYQQPSQLNLFVGASQVAMLSRYPTMADPIGSWTFDPQARRAYLVVGGVPNGIQFNLIQTAYIQVTMTLAVDYSTFDGANVVMYLALLLGISPSRIAVASVHSGSTVAAYNIFDSSNTTTDPTAQIASQNRLYTLSTQLATAVLNNTVDGQTYIAGYAVIALSIVPPPVNGTGTASTITVIAAPSSSHAALSTGGIIGVSVGAVLVGLLLAALIAWCCLRRRANNGKMWGSEEEADVRVKQLQFTPVTPSPYADVLKAAPSRPIVPAPPQSSFVEMQSVSFDTQQQQPTAPATRTVYPPASHGPMTIHVSPKKAPALPSTPPRMEPIVYEGETGAGLEEGNGGRFVQQQPQAQAAVRPPPPQLPPPPPSAGSRAVLPPPIIKLFPASQPVAAVPVEYGEEEDEELSSSEESPSLGVYEGEAPPTGDSPPKPNALGPAGMYAFYNQGAAAASASSSVSKPPPPPLPPTNPRGSLSASRAPPLPARAPSLPTSAPIAASHVRVGSNPPALPASRPAFRG